MKLYRTHAGWFGTQADAKTSSKEFETVEVPTDKPGLIRFLNETLAPPEDQFTSVYERQDPPFEDPRGDCPGAVISEPLDLDQLFAQATVRKQLHLAVGAIDAAINDIDSRPLVKPAPALPIEKIDAIDDEMFS